MFVTIYDAANDIAHEYDNLDLAFDHHPALRAAIKALMEKKAGYGYWTRINPTTLLQARAMIMVTETSPISEAKQLYSRAVDSLSTEEYSQLQGHGMAVTVSPKDGTHLDHFDPFVIHPRGAVAQISPHLVLSERMARGHWEGTIRNRELQLDLAPHALGPWDVKRCLFHYDPADWMDEYRLMDVGAKPDADLVFSAVLITGRVYRAYSLASLQLMLNKCLLDKDSYKTIEAEGFWQQNGLRVYNRWIDDETAEEIAEDIARTSREKDNVYVMLDAEDEVIGVTSSLRLAVMWTKGKAKLSEVQEDLKENEVSEKYGNVRFTTASLPVYYGQHLSELDRFHG